MGMETNFSLRPATPGDRDWIRLLLTGHWGSPLIVRQGESIHADLLPGWIAELEGERAGLSTYLIRGSDCEICTLNSLREGIGIGSALIETVRLHATAHGCRRLWLITTNDNLHALGFYQKRGFRMVAVYPGMVDASRQIKPEISLVGMNGIPIRDEIELELRLES